MSAVPAGIILPASTLTTRWFIVLALIVAFNTLIYLGLTLAKFVPWPAQIHPSRVRALLPETLLKDTDMTTPLATMPDPTEDPYLEPRYASAKRHLPRAFALFGGLILVITLVNLLVSSRPMLSLRLISFGFALLMIVLAQVFSRTRASARVVIWTWSILVMTFVFLLAYESVLLDDPLSLTYAALLLVLLPSMSMSWRASLVTGIAALGATVAAGVIVDAVKTAPWTIAAMAAYGSGLILLQLRLNLVDSLTLEELRSNSLASTDSLTGLLTRRGLLSLAPSVSAAVERTDGQLSVTICDITGLQAENLDYGLQYGDAVIAAVGRAVTSCAAKGDLVCRWSGDAFLILGVGEAPDPAAFAARVDAAVEESGVALGKRPIRVSVGSASQRPTESTMDQLVQAAGSQLGPTLGS